MFKRSTKPGPGFAVMQEEDVEQPKYPKPKILLIDLKDDSEAVLRKAGFNVSSGTFGRPYRVPKSDEFVPVIPNGSLPETGEQEIVIIDLLADEPLEEPQGQKVTSEGENDWWAKCSEGLIDPRPRVMISHRETFDRILSHGGVFVVFADAQERQQLLFGHFQRHYGIQKVSDIRFDNWSFLSILELAEVAEDRGCEIDIDDSDDELTRVLRHHVKKAKFLSSITYTHWSVRDDWFPLAKNKYGLSVGGIVVPSKDRKGIVLILPQLEKKSAFLHELVTAVLPSFSPPLFPHIEGARWVERQEYEIESISKLKDEKEKVRIDLQAKIQRLDNNIKVEREKFQYLHDLIGATDKKLVEAVKQTLALLGFQKVIDVDHEMEQAGESERDEDLQIDDYSPLLLVEVKGVGGLPSDDEALDVAKHIAPRMKKLRREDISGLTIINHQRHMPALERENAKPFRDTVTTSAKKKHDVGLLTAWDLFRLARGFLRNRWTHDQVKDVLYQKGRVLPIPAHYQFIGTVDEFWGQASALSIKMENGALTKGDRIAYELPVDFLEEDVESLQLDGMPVEKASSKDLIGVKTTLKKHQARRGARVYRITEAVSKLENQ